jgi:hypothetical protein
MTAQRSISWVIDSARTLEGGGFPVRRPFPTQQLSYLDPFLLLDHLGPVTWGPGEGIGAPDHPHRGFETVTYLLSGEMEHKDSAGHRGKLGPGDVQWMTAGRGVVHSELPSATFMRDGGVMHGFQIWVNLPARDKMMPPRYQDIPAAQIPQATSADGKVTVRIIAGESMGKSAVINTRIPITYLHYTLHPGGATRQSLPREANAMVYVVSGSVQLGQEKRAVHEGQLAKLSDGDDVSLANADDAPAPTSLLLLAGVPLNEPVARHGPFVMNTQEEIFQAIRDYQEGRLGTIAA